MQRGVYSGGKTGGQKSQVRERSELREVRAYDYGCNSGSSLGDAVF